jgi:hypothetical protein
MNQVARAVIPRPRPRRAVDHTTNARLQASYRQRDKGDRQVVEALGLISKQDQSAKYYNQVDSAADEQG